MTNSNARSLSGNSYLRTKKQTLLNNANNVNNRTTEEYNLRLGIANPN